MSVSCAQATRPYSSSAGTRRPLGPPPETEKPETEKEGRMPKFQGSIFDVDGVLVDSPHEKAWRESLRELMESSWRDIRDQTTWSPEAFTSRVYEEQMSGKPRMDAGRAALDYFHGPD